MVSVEDINDVLIIGAGTMGHSIAQVYAQAGIYVDLVDIDQEKLSHALNLIKSNLEILSEFNRVDSNKIPSILSKIRTSTDLQKTAQDKLFVLEAISEIPDLKTNIFAQLSEICLEETIFASNTSSLDIFQLTRKIKNLDRFIAHHWFSPPHIIPTVEIVPGRKTSQETIDFSLKMMEKLGKIPILIKKFIPSYIVNRIQNAIYGAMYELLARKIASPEQIDLAIRTTLGIRLPIVGIAQSQDFTGLDLVLDIIKAKGGTLGLLEEKVDNNQLGAKTGKGLFDYHGKSEEEILKKRDRLYLRQLEFLEETTGFKRI